MSVSSAPTWRRLVIWGGVLLAGLLIIYIIVSLASRSTESAATFSAPSHALGGSGGVSVAGSTASGGSINAPASTTGQTNTTITNQNVGSAYLIKSLAVSMLVADPRKTAADLQGWVLTTDPKASTNGFDVSQISDTQYHVTLRFAVQATLYSQIQQYLASYPEQHGGQLARIHEDVQDVTNDVVDTQARLENLQAEEGRLRTILAQATALNDILAVEQQLTNVQGQIEQIQAHLTSVTGQTTFYTVTIDLSPTSGTATPPTTSANWDGLAILQSAWGAALGFGQWLLTLLIWVGVFGIYIVPVVIIVLLVRRWRMARA